MSIVASDNDPVVSSDSLCTVFSIESFVPDLFYALTGQTGLIAFI
jgi:hypothetical protein